MSTKKVPNGRLLWILGAAAFALLIVVLLVALDPLPARHIVFATGPAGGGPSVAGERYRQILALHGVQVRLMATGGSLDNLRRLQDPKSGVDVAFVEAGTANTPTEQGIASLGTVFYSPFWFFCRSAPVGTAIHDLPGPRLSLGPEGSGTRALSKRLFSLNGTDIAKLDIRAYAYEQAAEKLLTGEIDGAFILSGWESPAVQRLLRAPGIGLYSFSQADAYVAMLPYLSKVVVPAGLGNLAANHPSTEVTLLASKTSLVVRKNLHPALQFLLLHAATEIHSGPHAFHRSGQFPAEEVIDIQLSAEARQFYKAGPSLLQRHLPFWLAELLHRLLVLMVPVAGIVYPLVLLSTRSYIWINRFRIVSLYGELRLLEQGLQTASADTRARLLSSLAELTERGSSLRVPRGQTDLVYQLQAHIAQVQQRYGA